VEQTSPAIQWSGQWSLNRNGSTSGGSAKLSQTEGSRAAFTFTGTDVTWIAYKDQWSGIASVYIDGVLVAAVDTYAPNATAQPQAAVYTASGLPWGTHTIVIEVSGSKRNSAKSSWVWVDAFEYVGAMQ
jgi:hypothetical protein